jgi:hypothetical protein
MTRTGLAAILGLALAGVVSAHGGVRAVIATDPSPPVAGQPSVVIVRFDTKTGAPAAITARHVRLVAEMTGHAMTPVAADLAPAPGAGRQSPNEFRGTVAFTMAGPWRMTVRADLGHDAITGVVDVMVSAEPQRAAVSAPQVVDMNIPVTPRPVPAWPIVMASIVLTLALEAGALARYAVKRGRRREQ